MQDKINSFKYDNITDKTASCLKVKGPWSKAVLNAPKMRAVVQMVLPHKKQNFSVVIFHQCKFEGDGNVS